jgi:hypothetical protein
MATPAVIGARFDDVVRQNQGSVSRVHAHAGQMALSAERDRTPSPAAWAGGAFVQTQRLTASDGVALDDFGIELELDGPDAAFIGALLDDEQRGALTVVVGGAAPCALPPPAPGFQPPTVAGSNVILSWSAAAGATSYAIEAGSQSGLVNLANFSTGNPATSFTAVAVPRGTYFVRVRGQNACGTGQASNERVVVVP